MIAQPDSNSIYNIQKHKKKDPLKLNFATLNVRGLHQPSKQLQLINYMNLYDITALGLSETKLSPSHSRFVCNSPCHTSYFHNVSTQSSGSGVGIILHNSLAKYVRSVNSFLGRLIYVDLYMKGRTKLRMIQLYLHASASSANRDDILSMYRFI